MIFVKDRERRVSVNKQLIIREGRQVILPQSFTEIFNLQEGDVLELSISDNDAITLIPIAHIPAHQKWFWTKEWPKGENEAEDDSKHGNVEKFDNVYDLIADLESDD